MKKIVLILSFMLSLKAYAESAPQKFQNPLFNDMLYGNGNKNFTHDVSVTPTSITDYDDKDMKGICEYLVEDEKGFLLKCEYPDSMEEYVLYEMFYARYQVDARIVGGEKKCRVWQCTFKIKNGIIEVWFLNVPIPHDSKVDNCAGEKDELQDFPSGEPKMNCLDELKARGWEKYIPGKWVKKVNTWQ